MPRDSTKATEHVRVAMEAVLQPRRGADRRRGRSSRIDGENRRRAVVRRRACSCDQRPGRAPAGSPRSRSRARSARTAFARTPRAARACASEDRWSRARTSGPRSPGGRRRPRRRRQRRPWVRRSQVPMSGSLVRNRGCASSSSRAIASGHQSAPAARSPSISWARELAGRGP